MEAAEMDAIAAVVLGSVRVDEIIAPFSCNVISMVYCIIDRHNDFIHDLRTGVITFDKYASDNLRSNLQSIFSALPEILEAGNY